MKILFCFLIILSLTTWAQKEDAPAQPDRENMGAIANPTANQKEIIKKAVKKAKKNKKAGQEIEK